MTAPKVLLAAALTLSPALAGTYPTQTDLQTVLGAAVTDWGVTVDVRAIEFGAMTSCPKGEAAALAEIRIAVITVNPACRWTRETLRVAITHEYGHLLNGDSTHDADKHSVMYRQVGGGRRITEKNRQYAREQIRLRSNRPTILIGHDEKGGDGPNKDATHASD